MDNESDSHTEEQQVPSPAGMGEEMAADSAQERLLAGLGVRAATVEGPGSFAEDSSDGGLLRQIKLLQGQLEVSRALRESEKDEYLRKLREAHETAAADKRSAALVRQRLMKIIEDQRERFQQGRDLSDTLVDSAFETVRIERSRLMRQIATWKELALRGDVDAARLHDAEDSFM